MIYGNGGRPFDRCDDFGSLRSSIGVGPQGDGIDVRVVEDDPYGYYRLQFLNSNTGEVLTTTPNLDPGSRFFLCTADLQTTTMSTREFTAGSGTFTTMQALTIQDARVGDLVIYNVSRLMSDDDDRYHDFLGFGVITRINNDPDAGMLITFNEVMEFDTTMNIENLSIPSSKLANGIVTTEKIANNAVTWAKLANDSVGGLNIMDETITPEKMSLIAVSQLSDYKKVATKVLDISDALYVLLKRIGATTAPTDDENPNRIRIIFAVDAPVYIEAVNETELSDGVTAGTWLTVPKAIGTNDDNTRLAIIPSTNSFGTKKIAGVLPSGFITVSMRKPDNSVISEEDKEAMLDSLSLHLYVLPTDEPTYRDRDASDIKWQQYVTIDGDGNYTNSNAAHCALSLDSFFRVANGSKYISWHSKDNHVFGVRMYDENFEFIGYGGVGAGVDRSVNVLAENNDTLDKDAKYVKFIYNIWDGLTSLNDILVTVNLVPYERKIDIDGVSVRAKYWETGATMTIIPSIPIIAGHKYRAYMKADIPISETFASVGIGYNGDFPNGTAVSGADLMNGMYFEMVANTTHPKSRLYLNARGNTTGAGAIVDASIEDVTDPSTIRRHSISEHDYQKASIVQKNGRRDGNYNTMLTIIHVSDVHGDDVRHQNMVEFAKRLAMNDETVVIVNTGDTVRNDGRDGTEFINDTYFAKYGIKYLVTVGNHEAFNTRDVGPVPESYMRQNLIDPLATDSGYVIDSGKTYYYVDVPTHSMRFIVLNFYESFTGAGTSMTAEQLNWFCSTLLSTPAGYGVVVCAHAPFLDVTKVEGCEQFYQDEILWRWDKMGYPQLAQIVDAFIDGTSYSGTIDSHSITANFSGKNTGVEFLAWLNGHEHVDRIGYYAKDDASCPLVHDQLIMNVTCTNTWLDMNNDTFVYDQTDYPNYTEMSDLPRKAFSATENAFNVYCFDRVRKVARVARIGSDMTYDLKERKAMEIPYVS